MTPREALAEDRWLHCSSCHEAVPERDATVICIECGEGMVFTANATLPSLSRKDLELIDAEASTAHDFIWSNAAVSKEQASAAIWTIHNLVRAVLATWTGSDGDLATRHDRAPEPPL